MTDLVPPEHVPGELQAGAPEVISVVGPDGNPVRVAQTPGLNWDRVKSFGSDVARAVGLNAMGPAGAVLAGIDAIHNPKVRAAGESISSAVGQGAETLAHLAVPNAYGAMKAREAAIDAPAPAAPGVDPSRLIFAKPPGAAADGKPGGAPGTGGSGGQPRFVVDQDKKAIDNVYSQQHQALAAGTQAGLARAAEEETAARESLASQERLAAEQLERQRVFKADRDHALKRLDESYAALARGPDPDRWWASRSTGQKVLAGIGMALGAFGGGDSNAGVDVINRAIQRDIEMQQKGLEAGVVGAGSMLGKMREAFGDDIEALAATRANTLAIAEQKLKDIAARAAAPEMKAKAMELAAQLEQQRFGEQQNLLDRRAERSLKYSNVQRLRAETMKDLAAAAAGGGRDLPAANASELGGLQGAEKVIDQVSAAWDALASGTGASLTQNVRGTDAAKFNDQAEIFAHQIGKAIAGERMTDADLETWKRAMPKPTDTKAAKELKVKTLRALARTRLESQQKGLREAGFDVKASTPSVSAQFKAL